LGVDILNTSRLHVLAAKGIETRMTNAEKRKAFVRRSLEIESEPLRDIPVEDRKKQSLNCLSQPKGQAQWSAFSEEDKKKIKESKVFVGFVKASGLADDPYDHENEREPLPDIRSRIDGQTYYFELGQIVDEELARRASISEKTGEITGGFYSELDPLLKSFREKCAKSYPTGGAPVDLLLYYSMQAPPEDSLLEYLKRYEAEISQLIRDGPFSRIWIYTDSPPRKVLWQAHAEEQRKR